MTEKKIYVSAVLKKIDEDFLTVETENGDQIRWPKSAVLFHPQVGEKLILTAQKEADFFSNRKEQTKELVNFLLASS